MINEADVVLFANRNIITDSATYLDPALGSCRIVHSRVVYNPSETLKWI